MSKLYQTSTASVTVSITTIDYYCYVCMCMHVCVYICLCIHVCVCVCVIAGWFKFQCEICYWQGHLFVAL